jgi:hypothetical protein
VRAYPDFHAFADFGFGFLNDGEDYVDVPQQFIYTGSAEEFLEFAHPNLISGIFDAESASRSYSN